MDAEDLAQIAESLHKAVAADPLDARSAVAAFGWHDLLDEDVEMAVRSLFPVLGDVLTPGSFLDDVLVVTAGEASMPVRVVLPPAGRSRPASSIATDGRIAVDGVVQRGTGPLLVPSLDADQRVRLLRCEDTEIGAEGDTLDPDSGWVSVRTGLVGGDEIDSTADTWPRMVLIGRRALAHELVAIGDRMLRLTVEHVSSREQFGHRLASFQAVKHQLADVYLWREAAALAADASWEDDSADSGALAKAAACRFSRSARATCQQLLGGMGFTWEHEFHRYLRRALTLEPLLGDLHTVHAELGAALRAETLSDSLAPL